jgi:hypothetical protein
VTWHFTVTWRQRYHAMSASRQAMSLRHRTPVNDNNALPVKTALDERSSACGPAGSRSNAGYGRDRIGSRRRAAARRCSQRSWTKIEVSSRGSIDGCTRLSGRAPRRAGSAERSPTGRGARWDVPSWPTAGFLTARLPEWIDPLRRADRRARTPGPGGDSSLPRNGRPDQDDHGSCRGRRHRARRPPSAGANAGICPPANHQPAS